MGFHDGGRITVDNPVRNIRVIPELIDLIREIQAEGSKTVLLVEHNMNVVMENADFITVMNHGKVLQVGTPIEIYERPNCRFVADFIGESNFLNGRVIAVEGHFCTVDVPDQGVVVGQVGPGVRVGDEVMVSVRPEKIRLFDKHPERRANTYPVTVEMVAYIGSDTRIIVRTEHGRRLDVWEQNMISTLDVEAYYASGDQAFMSWRAENALVLKD